jgi:hypothetical protein
VPERVPGIDLPFVLDIEDRNPYHLLRDLILFRVFESDNRDLAIAVPDPEEPC